MPSSPNQASMIISVVGHDQSDLAELFLHDLYRCDADAKVVFVNNTRTALPPSFHHFPLQIIQNQTPKGFAANHNQVLNGADAAFVCVANPDIRLDQSPFAALLSAFNDPNVGLVVPQVLSPTGSVEDSVRSFPTPVDLLKKFLGRYDGRFEVSTQSVQPIPWAAGMFMLFRREAFEAVGGFDEGFHLYYEDVDICARLWKSGWQVVHQPNAKVIHHAQRASRHNWRYLRWHLSSVLRYFFKHGLSIHRLGQLVQKHSR